MGNTGRATENVVREMDPDVVVREAESERSLAGDDVVRGRLSRVVFTGYWPSYIAFFTSNQS